MISEQLPSISVIVPNLHSPTVARTVQSLCEQESAGDFEILVVGQDRFDQVHTGGQVRLIKTPKPVIQSMARNIGIRASKGEILAFIDSDCVAAPDWLYCLRWHYDNPQVMVVGGGVAISGGNYWTMADNVATFHEYLVSSPANPRPQLASLNLSVRRAALDDVGLFDESLPIAEDVDLTSRLRLKGYQLYFDPTAQVTHLPQRRSLVSLLNHAYRFGRYSRKLDPRYRDLLEAPWFLRRAWSTAILSPLLAAGVLLRAVTVHGLPVRYWHTLPVVYIAKLAWCAGAFQTLRGQPLPVAT
jgi:GT2 family glycosyltransferase